MKHFFFIFLMICSSSNAESSVTYQYVITETGKPTSFDPLDGDQTQNLPVARMIYTTPLEITSENTLASLVLESFSYDPAARKISWTVKSGLKFNDGSDLNTEDVVFAVTRMAFTRPQFPVVEDIIGIKEWIKEKTPLKSLPKGIKVSGNKIEISFSRSHQHPLFRFCLELFSVIPKKCVNLETNKISCEKLPGSGYYVLTKDSQDSIHFNRSLQKSGYFSGPESIEFKYIPAVDVVKRFSDLPDTSIVAGNEGLFVLNDLLAIKEKMKLQNLPATRFQVLQINPTVGPFKDKICRQVFAEKFREHFSKLSKGVIRAESSIFVSIVPGYMSEKELNLSVKDKVGSEKVKKCQAELAKSSFKWGYVKNEKNTLFFEALRLTLRELGLDKNEPVALESRKELANQFMEGKVAVFNAGSGFWPLDPAGDLQMLFTPNLHKPLEHISKDEMLQTLIRKVQDNESDTNAFKSVNQYLYEEGMFNVYSHVRRFFAAKDAKLLTEFPAAITSPSPWQVFRSK